MTFCLKTVKISQSINYELAQCLSDHVTIYFLHENMIDSLLKGVFYRYIKLFLVPNYPDENFEADRMYSHRREYPLA